MIFLDRGDEIVVPLGLVMGGDNGTWYFDGKSADRLWHKSASVSYTHLTLPTIVDV